MSYFGLTASGGSYHPEIVIPKQYDYSYGLFFGDIILIVLTLACVLSSFGFYAKAGKSALSGDK